MYNENSNKNSEIMYGSTKSKDKENYINESTGNSSLYISMNEKFSDVDISNNNQIDENNNTESGCITDNDINLNDLDVPENIKELIMKLILENREFEKAANDYQYKYMKKKSSKAQKVGRISMEYENAVKKFEQLKEVLDKIIKLRNINKLPEEYFDILTRIGIEVNYDEIMQNYSENQENSRRKSKIKEKQTSLDLKKISYREENQTKDNFLNKYIDDKRHDESLAHSDENIGTDNSIKESKSELKKMLYQMENEYKKSSFNYEQQIENLNEVIHMKNLMMDDLNSQKKILEHEFEDFTIKGNNDKLLISKLEKEISDLKKSNDIKIDSLNKQLKEFDGVMKARDQISNELNVNKEKLEGIIIENQMLKQENSNWEFKSLNLQNLIDKLRNDYENKNKEIQLINLKKKEIESELQKNSEIYGFKINENTFRNYSITNFEGDIISLLQRKSTSVNMNRKKFERGSTVRSQESYKLNLQSIYESEEGDIIDEFETEFAEETQLDNNLCDDENRDSLCFISKNLEISDNYYLNKNHNQKYDKECVIDEIPIKRFNSSKESLKNLRNSNFISIFDKNSSKDQTFLRKNLDNINNNCENNKSESDKDKNEGNEIREENENIENLEKDKEEKEKVEIIKSAYFNSKKDSVKEFENYFKNEKIINPLSNSLTNFKYSKRISLKDLLESEKEDIFNLEENKHISKSTKLQDVFKDNEIENKQDYDYSDSCNISSKKYNKKEFSIVKEQSLNIIKSQSFVYEYSAEVSQFFSLISSNKLNIIQDLKLPDDCSRINQFTCKKIEEKDKIIEDLVIKNVELQSQIANEQFIRESEMKKNEIKINKLLVAIDQMKKSVKCN